MMQALQPYMSSIVAGLVILAGLILALLIFRVMNRRIVGDKGARLGVSDYHDIDKDRRLVLVRRDDVEHLILIGGDHDLVIEQNIGTGLDMPRSLGPAIQMPQSPAVSNVQPLRPSPRPPVFGNMRPTLRPIEPGEAAPSFGPRDPA